MNRRISLIVFGLFTVLVSGAARAGAAQDSFSPLIRAMDQMAAQNGRELDLQRLSRKFHPFIVSQTDAAALLNGLQQGHAIELPNPRLGKVARLRPATRPMSLANAYVALGLVRLNLARYGISQPSPAQLTCALNGGAFDRVNLRGQHENIRLKGVLKLRRQGRDWDAIAKAIGVNADALHYDMLAANMALAHPGVIPSYAAIKAFPEARAEGDNAVATDDGTGSVAAQGAGPTLSTAPNGANVQGIAAGR